LDCVYQAVSTRNVSLELRNVSLELRNVSLELQQIHSQHALHTLYVLSHHAGCGCHLLQTIHGSHKLSINRRRDCVHGL